MKVKDGTNRTIKRNFGRSRKSFEKFLHQVRKANIRLDSFVLGLNQTVASYAHRRTPCGMFVKRIPSSVYEVVLKAFARSFSEEFQGWCFTEFGKESIFEYLNEDCKYLRTILPFGSINRNELQKKTKLPLKILLVPLGYSDLIAKTGRLPKERFDTLCYLTRKGKVNVWFINYIMAYLKTYNYKQYEKFAVVVHSMLCRIFYHEIPSRIKVKNLADLQELYFNDEGLFDD